MRRSALALLALMGVAILVAGGAACQRDRADDVVVELDGSPRVPDDEGVATELTKERITLDGERTYRVSPRLVSFSTYTGAVEPMLGRRGQYVHIGLDRDGDDEVMVWMAGIAHVVHGAGVGGPPPGPGSKPAVYYTGDLVDVEEHDGGRRGVFRDGTVIALAAGVEVPEPPAGVSVEIDPVRHAAIAVRARR
jgi:hypothetical protein